MELLRTPDERFDNLPGYPFAPHYLEVESGDGGSLRVHYVDEGPRDAPPVLLMHGEPSWSYLYRKMIPILAVAGHRVIAPDLVGFGRSDKPARPEDYTYQRHVDWMRGVIEKLDLQHITLVGQDWGGLIGLRLAAECGDRFDRIVAANTGLPTGDADLGQAFKVWQKAAKLMRVFDVGKIVQGGTVSELPPEIIARSAVPGGEVQGGSAHLPAAGPDEA
jgi:haloalkane dehalogenase